MCSCSLFPLPVKPFPSSVLSGGAKVSDKYKSRHNACIRCPGRATSLGANGTPRDAPLHIIYLGIG
jgi:hypothetical protein